MSSSVGDAFMGLALLLSEAFGRVSSCCGRAGVFNCGGRMRKAVSRQLSAVGGCSRQSVAVCRPASQGTWCGVFPCHPFPEGFREGASSKTEEWD